MLLSKNRLDTFFYMLNHYIETILSKKKSKNNSFYPYTQKIDRITKNSFFFAEHYGINNVALKIHSIVFYDAVHSKFRN